MAAARTEGRKTFSVVVPVYNEARNVGPLVSAVDDATKELEDTRWEIVFVDDGSKDDSLLVLGELAAEHPHVKVIALSKNFGKEVALSAGVTYATGDAIVTIDADLQHPPSLIPLLVGEWRKGADVVVAERRKTARKSLLRRVSSRLFRVFARFLGSDASRLVGTDFRLIDARVRDAFLLVPERRRAYRAVVDWLGFTRTTVEFDAGQRHEGSSTYPIGRLFELALDMILSQSAKPLLLLLYLGLAIMGTSSLSLAWMFLAYYFVDPKWKYTPLAQATVFNTLLIGIVLTAMGVLGLYVARIHEEVLARPLFVVRATLNCEAESPRAAKARVVPPAA